MIFVLRILLSFLFKFKRLNKEVIIFNSTVNRFYNFNSKYLFEYFIKNLSDKYECRFIIDDPILKDKLEKEIGNYFITSKKIKDIIYILNAKTWITSTIDPPIISLCKNKSRIVFHLGHGVPLKNIILAEDNISILRFLNRFIRTRLFTHATCYSNEFSYVMENAFKNKNIQFIPIGQPRNDQLVLRSKELEFNKIKEILQNVPDHSVAILYAPTWRSYDNVKFFPFDNLSPEELNQTLINSNSVLFLRKHPYYGCDINNKYLEQSHIFWFNSEKFPDIMEYLSYFDQLITDYSSIYLDYICLDRPIGFIPYDLEVYKEKVGFSYDYEKMLCGDLLLNKEKFLSFLSGSIDLENSKKARHYIADLINAKNTNNCLENSLLIEKLINERDY